MFFVNNDQTRVFHWHEYSGSCAHDESGGTGSGGTPGSKACIVAQPGVQQRGLQPESFAKPRNQLWRQSDFRHQQQRLFALIEHILNPLQVDLGLAAASNTVEQKGGKGIAFS